MKEVNPKQTALFLGTFVSLIHIVWSVLVLLGFAQILVDFIYWLHFLNNPFSVQSFEVSRALILIVITFCVGFGVGFVAGSLWNTVLKKISKI